MEEDARGDKRCACEKEAAEGNLRRGCGEPLASEEAEQHGSQGRNEAESEIASAVEAERRSSREEIEEPEVEGLAEVHVLVPVSGESVQKMRVPLLRNTD